MPLPWQQDEVDQVPKRVDQGDDLCGQPSARAPDRLVLRPPFAPVAFWWTRLMVPSAMTYSKSGSPRSALNARSNTPWLAHRRKRLNTEFQLPNMAGRSRQGAPVRAIQSTASTNWRLSAPERPGSPGLPGSRCAIWFHCASLRHDRSKAGLLSQPSISTQPAWEARTTDCQQALTKADARNAPRSTAVWRRQRHRVAR